MALAISPTSFSIVHGQNAQIPLGATGLTGGVDWDLVDGSLPPNMQMNGHSIIGLCQAPGASTFTLRCTDLGTFTPGQSSPPVAYVEAEVTITVT